jgi:hypothetical protein
VVLADDGEVQVTYRKIGGYGRIRQSLLVWGSASLWLEPETGRLLSVKSWGFREEYRRIELRDVQAISSRRTVNWLVIAAIWAFLAITFGALGYFTVENAIGKGTLFALSALCAIALAIDLLLGPTCRTTLTTAVQTEELGSFNRLRRLERGMEELRPLVWKAQRAVLNEPRTSP